MVHIFSYSGHWKKKTLQCKTSELLFCGRRHLAPHPGGFNNTVMHLQSNRALRQRLVQNQQTEQCVTAVSLKFCVAPVMEWQPVQGVPHLSPTESEETLYFYNTEKNK